MAKKKEEKPVPQAFGDRVVIEPAREVKVTPGGIALPDGAEQDDMAPNQGTVRSIGPGKYSANGEPCPVRLSKGDRVLFHGMAGVYFDYDDVQYVAVGANDILAVLP